MSRAVATRRSVEVATPVEHPLESILTDALEQCASGKGAARHGAGGGEFMDQQWLTVARIHGRGFLTGQAVKKLNEAAQLSDPEEFRKEVLGAIVYAAMSILYTDKAAE